MSGKDIPRDPEQLRRDIERTRRELGDTVEALAHKADVPARVKEGVHEGVDKVKEKAGEAAARVDQAASRTAAKAQVAADAVADRAAVAAGQVADRAAQAVDSLPPPVRDKVVQAGEQARRRPVAVAGGLAFLVLLVVWLIRRGR